VGGLEIVGNNCPQEILNYCVRKATKSYNYDQPLFHFQDDYLTSLLSNLNSTSFTEVVQVILTAVGTNRPVEIVLRIERILDAVLSTNLLLEEYSLLEVDTFIIKLS